MAAALKPARAPPGPLAVAPGMGPAKPAAAPGPSQLMPRLLEWAQHALVAELVSPGDAVCHVFCGRGKDAATWLDAGIGHYSGIDISSFALQDAKEEWGSAAAAARAASAARRLEPAPEPAHPRGEREQAGAIADAAADVARADRGVTSKFIGTDPCLNELDPHSMGCPPGRKGFDIVCCSSHANDCFLSEATAHQFVQNVARLLRPGGFFFGLVPDSSSLWYKFQKVAEANSGIRTQSGGSGAALQGTTSALAIRSSQYVITFDSATPFDGSPFGIRYFFRFADADSSLAQPNLMVHFPTFIRLLENAGLEYIDIQNLESFYDDHRLKFQDKLLRLFPSFAAAPDFSQGFRARIPQAARDLLGLHSAFVFQRREGAPRPVPSSSSDGARGSSAAAAGLAVPSAGPQPPSATEGRKEPDWLGPGAEMKHAMAAKKRPRDEAEHGGKRPPQDARAGREGPSPDAKKLKGSGGKAPLPLAPRPHAAQQGQGPVRVKAEGHKAPKAPGATAANVRRMEGSGGVPPHGREGSSAAERVGEAGPGRSKGAKKPGLAGSSGSRGQGGPEGPGSGTGAGKGSQGQKPARPAEQRRLPVAERRQVTLPSPEYSAVWPLVHAGLPLAAPAPAARLGPGASSSSPASPAAEAGPQQSPLLLENPVPEVPDWGEAMQQDETGGLRRYSLRHVRLRHASLAGGEEGPQ